MRDPIYIPYVRVSTANQEENGNGLRAQETAIRAEAERRTWRLAGIASDDRSGRTLDRPGLRTALDSIAAGKADGLVVAKLDRLSRSVVDFGNLLVWFEQAGATLVALDMGVDTSTPGGRLVANVFASVAQWEREVIAQRTRDGLAEVRASGRPVSGPSVSDRPELVERIRAMREDGMTLQAIAHRLNDEGVATPRGGARWRPNSVYGAVPRRATRPRTARPTLPAELPALGGLG